MPLTVQVPRQLASTSTAKVAAVDSIQRAHRSLRHIPALDGVRAVAVMAVIGFHVAPEHLRGGYTGVDLFFVLSGYLITSVILHDVYDGRFSLTEFYLRRVQRLLPNATLMVAVTLLLSWAFLRPLARVVATHGLWALANMSNVYTYEKLGSYWGTSAVSSPLLHTWSLAVEEQFYLIFPLLLLVGKRRWHLAGTFLLFAASLLACALVTPHDQAWAFYLLPTRAWEPLLGALLAVGVRTTPPATEARWPAQIREPLAIAGAVLAIGSFFLIRDVTRFPGTVALLPALGALAIIASIHSGSVLANRLLSNHFLQWIGRLSYSLYLWHWPLIILGSTYALFCGKSVVLGRCVGAGVGIVCALLAYHLVKAPLRLRGRGRMLRLGLIAVLFAVSLTACLGLRHVAPVVARGQFARASFYGMRYSVGQPSKADVSIASDTPEFYQPIPRPPLDIWKRGGIIHEWGNGDPEVVVLGSSHALMYASVVDDICRDRNIPVAFLAAADGTSALTPINPNPSFPTRELASEFDAARKQWMARWNPETVLMMDRWDSHAYDERFSKKLEQTLRDIAPHAKTVVLVTQPPALTVGQNVDLREYVTWYQRRFGVLPKMRPNESESFRQSLPAIFGKLQKEFPNVRVLRADQLFYAPDGTVRYLDGREFLYVDDNHLSTAGAEKVGQLLASVIGNAHE